MPSGLEPRDRDVKRAVLALAARAAEVPFWRPLVHDVAIVFMLHRFADSERGVEGLSAADLRANLSFLRRQRYRLASFGDLLAGGDDPVRPNSAMVLFTVDDGYADFASIAAPVFAEFDCPVTVFLTTGPVDDRTWFWWDRIEYAVHQTRSPTVQLEIGGTAHSFSLRDARHRRHASRQITETLKRIPNHEKAAALGSLTERLAVEVPATPPERYAAMSWGDVRACAARGVSFGPHTISHPMLPQVSAEEAEWEITTSWQRLRAECSAALPVFGYPNGAYSAREVTILSRIGLAGAVTTQPYYASPQLLAAQTPEMRFRLPRFSFPADRAEFIAIVTGLHRVHSLMRDGVPAWRCGGILETESLPSAEFPDW